LPKIEIGEFFWIKFGLGVWNLPIWNWKLFVVCCNKFVVLLGFGRF